MRKTRNMKDHKIDQSMTAPQYTKKKQNKTNGIKPEDLYKIRSRGHSVLMYMTQLFLRNIRHL